jgi:hypothetical protein
MFLLPLQRSPSEKKHSGWPTIGFDGVAVVGAVFAIMCF